MSLKTKSFVYDTPYKYARFSIYTMYQTHVSLNAYKFDKIYYMSCKSGYLLMEEIYTGYTVSLNPVKYLRTHVYNNTTFIVVNHAIAYLIPMHIV